ncbi:DUF2298 domain-containing protein [Chitinolyticbacter meiyuanensis]|uniref:DUF2298 domain-containing protein n=1 Tax=Chitinolyticbacter meiyuanensis TaxID=682798 RepID=UPI0011E5A9A8|nr:hypothetical protein [Chitinolyticbacter meiyuanensis]
MSMIFTALTVLLLLVHLAALGQVVKSNWIDRHIVRASSLLGIVLVLFCVEHFVGLGRLSWLWPITFAASVFILRRDLANKAFWLGELPFIVPFGWALLWRFLWPNLDASAEKITNLYFIRNYIDGATLPPPDQWLPGQLFDSYYALLHYAAALMGRLFDLSAGWSMNLAFCVVIGLMGSLAWSMASRWVASPRWRAVIVAAVIVGGNGLAPLLPALFQGPYDAGNATTRLWASTRFTGTFDQSITADWGRQLFNSGPPELQQQPYGPRDLPLENTGYYIYLGDLHPPLAGFVLLFFALALIARLQTGCPPQNRECADAEAATLDRLQFLLGVSLPVTIAANAWVFPLQLALIAGWVLWRYAQKQPFSWKALLVGAGTGVALIYPFLVYFTGSGLSLPIRVVTAIDHTPAAQWLAIWWPILWLVVLSLARRFGEDSPSARFGAWVAGGMVLALVISEVFYVDDPIGDRYNRFNTTLKWWSWLFPAGLALLSAPLVGAERRAWRWLAALPLAGCLAFLWPQVQYLATQPKPEAGKLAGDGWLMNDGVHRRILEYLRSAERGIVVEGLDGGSYVNTSAFALHAAQPAMNGWPAHEGLWRGDPYTIRADADAVRQLYHAQLANPVEWLLARNVRYVVWARWDQQRDPAAFATLQQQLAASYVWHPLADENGASFGVWERR